MASKPQTKSKSRILSTLTRELQCGICQEEYNKKDRLPKILPCLDTICLCCVKDSIGKSSAPGSFECPVCDKVLEGLPDVLKNNPTLMALIDAVGDKEAISQLQCDVHVDKVAKFICLDCQVSICTSCYSSGMKTKSHYSHAVIEIEEAVAENMALFNELMDKIIAAEKSLVQQKQEAEERIQKRYVERNKDLAEQIAEARRDIDENKKHIEEARKQIEEQERHVNKKEKEHIANIEASRREELEYLLEQVKEAEQKIAKQRQSAESINMVYNVLNSKQAPTLLPGMMENLKLSARELDLQRENLRGSGIFAVLASMEHVRNNPEHAKYAPKDTFKFRGVVKSRSKSAGGTAESKPGERKRGEEEEIKEVSGSILDSSASSMSSHVASMIGRFNYY